jgi:cobalt-zinc-cadmium efflux system outer membrane protein
VSITGEGLRAKAAARAEVDASEKAVERARFEAAAAARRAWAVVAAARQREGIAREAARLAAQLAEAMRLQYEAGEVPALDLRLARLALAQADTNVLDAMREQAEASRELSRIVGRSVDPASISGDPLAAAPPASGDVAETRSDVLAARSTVVSAEASLARARAAAVPRMGLGLYTQWDDETGWILGPNLEWEIPSFNRNQEGRGEASGELLASRAELGAVEAGADVERRTSLARVATADAALAPTEDLEAEAREALISIDTGRRAGELDLPTTLILRDRVLGAMTALVELRRAVAEARIDLLLATEDRALVPEGAR